MALNMIDGAELGVRLRTFRFRCGDPAAKQIAREIGKSESTLLRWEQPKGDGYPPLKSLEILCRVYSRELSRAYGYEIEIRLQDLLDADYDTRVWFNAASARAA